MEMNLYGVASIKLDKIRGHQIKSSVIWLFVVYLMILIVSFMLPESVYKFNLGKAELLESDNGE